MQVYLLRHGIAEYAKFEANDADRPLTSEGKRKLRQVLKSAAEAGLDPELIITSPFKRAVQTAEIAKDVLAYDQEVRRSKLLTPGSHPDHVWHEIREYRDVGALLLVGHNPLFASLSAYLLGTPAAQVDFKKGAIMRIDFDSLTLQPRGTLRWYLTARLAAPK